jgi:exonuclease SbcD
LLLIHAADIHLDSPLRGLSRIGEETATELRLSTRRALENLVDLVLERQADLLVIAGDLYDGTWHDFGTGQFFIEQMIRLNDEKVPVVIASGNHDAASQITRALTLPPQVHMLSTDEPQSITFDELGAVVHGQGYAVRNVQANLAAAYPKRIPELINIGVLHTVATGSDDHLSYAPCSVADLQALRYNYMALGHIHKRCPVAEGEFPAHFSGNLQGRNPRETGPKGVLIVDITDNSPATVEFQPVDVARWERIDIDLTTMADYDEMATCARDLMREAENRADGRKVITRVNLAGTSKIASSLTDDERLRADMESIAAQSGVVLDKVRVHVRPPEPPDPDAQLFRNLINDAAASLSDDRNEMTQTMQQLERSIRDTASGADASGLDLSDPIVLKDLVQRAHDQLDARLAERQA